MTKPKPARNGLRTSQIRYQRLFETARNGILILDAVTLKITDVNPFMTELLGYSRAEVLGKEIWEIGLLSDRDTSQAAFKQLLETGYIRYENLPLQTRHGERREVEFVSNVFDEDGHLVIQCDIRDFTVRKKLEEQLRQAQKLEAIGTLAGGMAHDFNNILGAIIGYCELAQKVIASDSPAQPHLSQVLVASARATDLVRQILTFSRQKEPERKALQLQAIVGETMNLLQVSIPSMIEIHQNINPATPPILGDYKQIQQLIMSLCANAVRAMEEEGGILEIGLTPFHVNPDFAGAHSEIKEGPHIRLTVSDTGCGMDRAVAERIFEPFFTTNAPGTGTGLGLAVVHGVVRNHGGTITVYSQPEVGSTFSIYLPIYDGQAVAVVPNSVSLPRGNGEHILFVDDEQSLVSLGKIMLEELGYRITATTDGGEALAAFKLRPGDFDLVVTDQTMPHLSGGDLAKALLQIRPGLPVILTTGYSSVMNPEKANAIGIRELLFKPTTTLAMAEAIARALGHQRIKRESDPI
jgi:PAS domain S-box-containing protein